MKFKELIKLAESIYPNVDFKMSNKKLWSVIHEVCEGADIPNGYAEHVVKIMWVMAKLDQDTSKQQLSD